MTRYRYLAIIPARGGSKRLPRKNLLPLGKKPLLNWTIEAALGARGINEVRVTSDDQEILSVAKCAGARVIERPTQLSLDTTSTVDTVKHAIGHGSLFDYVVVLQPTSPFRASHHIESAIELLETRNADAVISVTETDHSPLWANRLPEDGSMEGFLSNELINLRSQELPVYYRLNGAIYICKIKRFLEENTFFFNSNIYAYVMGRQSSVDIDTEIDLRWAEFLNTK